MISKDVGTYILIKEIPSTHPTAKWDPIMGSQWVWWDPTGIPVGRTTLNTTLSSSTSSRFVIVHFYCMVITSMEIQTRKPYHTANNPYGTCTYYRTGVDKERKSR